MFLFDYWTELKIHLIGYYIRSTMETFVDEYIYNEGVRHYYTSRRTIGNLVNNWIKYNDPAAERFIIDELEE